MCFQMTRNKSMNSSSSTHLVGWGFLLLLTISSLVFGFLQLDGLPDLGVQFGPDLTVRAVPVDRETERERQEFKRGDRLVALQGQSISNLRELRSVLQNLPDHSAALEPEKLDENGEIIEDAQAKSLRMRKVSYQIVRPLYRFPIALQGMPEDPTALPPGVEPSDRLVELDGRSLQTKIGPEGVRSIVASRPEALLVFERKNAVFFGSVMVPTPESPGVVFGIFGAVLVIMAGLWWFRSEELAPLASVAVSLETLCVGWIALLAFEYQWTLSDVGLSAVVMVAFSMVRPIAFFAHNIGDGRGTQTGWTAFLMGIVASAVMLGLFIGGPFSDAEQALHVVALITGLFVVYEIFVASIETDAPRSSLGEGSGYIAWILVLALFSALLAWYLAPISFEENRWRWFATVIVGLVWFGDLLYCFRGLPAEGWALISGQQDRQREVLEYLDIVKLLLPETTSFLVVSTDRETYMIEEDAQRLQVQPSSDALHDAMSILIQERARIPLPPLVERQTHPMGGIADSMDMVLALPLSPPDGAIEVDDLHIILVAIREDDAPDTQLEPEDVSAETIDLLQSLLSAEVWVAILIEAYATICRAYLVEGQRGMVASQPARPGQESRALLAERRRASELEAELKRLRHRNADGDAALEPPPPTPTEPPGDSRVAFAPAEGERVARLQRPETASGEPVDEQPVDAQPINEYPTSSSEDSTTIESSSEATSAPSTESEQLSAPTPQPVEPPPANYRIMLEPELIDALEYLLTSREPLVLGGSEGSGKQFIARVAREMDGEFSGELRSLDVQDAPGFWDSDGLLEDAFVDGLFERLDAGSIIIRHADMLSDTMLAEICDAAMAANTRLYLAFDDPNAEQVSVLAKYEDALQDRLEHRELIVPDFAHRPSIFEPVLGAFVEDSLAQYGDLVEGEGRPYLGDDAIDALRGYDFPGQFREARDCVEQGVSSAVERGSSNGEILPEDLGL